MDNDSELDRAVAHLCLYRADDDNVKADIPIPANAEFDLGRDQVSSLPGVNDLTISKHHLRFHCVTYGENDLAIIEPMLYVRVLSRHGVRLAQTVMNGSNSTCFLQRGHSAVLLNHGDTLQISAKISIRYDTVFMEANEGRERLWKAAELEARIFANQYTISPRVLGVGGFASVFLATNTKTHRQVACKIVPLPKKPPVPALSDWTSRQGRQAPAHAATGRIVAHRKKCQDLRREFEVLKGTDHPNIIRLEKAIYATDHIFIFQELICGGDLLSYLERKGGLDEPEAAVVVFQVLKALEYLHSRGVVHRDIKPENILLTSWRRGARIVLTDFGQARKLVDESITSQGARTTSNRMRSLVGTKGYAAPEVYMRPDDHDGNSQSGYNELVDVWSIGCLAGTLLTNSFLFPHQRSNNSCELGRDDPANMTVAFSLKHLDTSQDWQGASGKSKSFIRACAMVDDSQRLTVAQALQHPWVAHPSFAAEMHAEYARAVADWAPRANPNDLIEYLKAPLPTTKDIEAGYEARLHQEVRSRYFSSQETFEPSRFRTFDAGIRSAEPRGQPTHINGADTQLQSPSAQVEAYVDDEHNAEVDNLNTSQPEDLAISSYASIQDFAPPMTSLA